ncbi:hypothetical protein GCM10028791_26670 [Echinicola sediminis]
MTFFVQNAVGQACCSGGVPLSGALGLGAADGGNIQFLFTYDRNELKDLMDQESILNDDTRERRTVSQLLEINYGLKNRLSLALVLPYVQQERIVKGFQGADEVTVTRGLGDLLFLTKYEMVNPKRNSSFEWILGGGVKMPTGRTNFKNNNGLPLIADMQPGSGSWDGILWNYFTVRKVLFPRASIVSIMVLRKSGTNNSYNESQEYRFGDELMANLGISYNFLLYWPIDVFLFGKYRSQTEDKLDQTIFPNSGGRFGYLVPGFNLNFNPNFAFRASADFPVYRKVKGTQLTTSKRLTFSLFYNLQSKKNKIPAKFKIDEL